MFHVGQLVICVDVSTRGGSLNGLTRGTIYTISEIVHFCDCGFCSGTGDYFHLMEITRSNRLPYETRRFRPLDDSRLEIFRKALRDAPVDGVLVE